MIGGGQEAQLEVVGKRGTLWQGCKPGYVSLGRYEQVACAFAGWCSVDLRLDLRRGRKLCGRIRLCNQMVLQRVGLGLVAHQRDDC